MNPPSMVDSEVNDTITQELQENDNPIWAADSTQEEQESEESKQQEPTTNFLRNRPADASDEEHKTENEDVQQQPQENENDPNFMNPSFSVAEQYSIV